MHPALWIREHQVRSELRPRSEKRSQGVVRAGFELALLATGPRLGVDPGSAACRDLHEELLAVGRAAILPELGRVDYAPFDRALHIAAGQDTLPEIELRIDLGPVQPAALHRLEERLRQLGVRTSGAPPVERRDSSPVVPEPAALPDWFRNVA